MPKFCGFCGMQNDDDSFVCGSCGTPLQQPQAQYQPVAERVAAPQEQTVVYGQPSEDYSRYYSRKPQPSSVKAPAKKKISVNIDFKKIISTATKKVTETVENLKKGDKKSIITVGGAAAVLVVLLIIIVSIFSVGGEEKAAEKVLKALDKNDAGSIVKLIPKFCFGESDFGFVKSESDWEEDLANNIGYFREDVTDALNSSDFKMKWEIIDIDFFGDKMLDEFSDGLELYGEFKESKLKKGALIVAEVECKKGGEKHYSEMEIYAYKYGASWYVYTWSVKDSVQN